MPIPVPTDTHMEFKLVGLFNLAQETNNIFHYHKSGVSDSTLDQHAAGLWFWIADALLDLTASVQKYLLIQASILDPDTAEIVNGETYLINSADQPGHLEEESLPPEDVWTFKYLRPSSVFRHGFKRFSGVPESGNNNGFAATGIVANLNTLAGFLDDTILAYTIDVDGLPDTPITGSTMHPELIQKQLSGDVLDTVTYYDITNVVFDKIGSQNSRKYGVGV